MEKMEYMEPYRIVTAGGVGEITEKKSRFIATVRPVESEEEAAAFLEEMKKKYWDARHNCSAFVIGRRGELTRCSDDGEPSGTAGRPMLEVLLGEKLCNTAVVVTRYFGGTLLGTGGLVRAYSAAVKAGLAESRTAWMRAGERLLLETDYNGVGKIQYLLGQRGVPVEAAVYEAAVKMQILVPRESSRTLQKEVTEATCGKTRITVMEQVFYAEEESGKK